MLEGKATSKRGTAGLRQSRVFLARYPRNPPHWFSGRELIRRGAPHVSSPVVQGPFEEIAGQTDIIWADEDHNQTLTRSRQRTGAFRAIAPIPWVGLTLTCS